MGEGRREGGSGEGRGRYAGMEGQRGRGGREGGREGEGRREGRHGERVISRVVGKGGGRASGARGALSLVGGAS